MAFPKHSQVANDPTGVLLPDIHLPGFLGTNAQRIAYPTAQLTQSMRWYESDTNNRFIWTGVGWTAESSGGGGGPVADGFATLNSGIATVATSFAAANPTAKYVLVPQDTDILGTMRVDNIIPGVSFDINSTGNTDDGVVYWQIWN